MTGELRRGGQITIDHDTSRLPDWRRSQAGDTASRLFASLRFYPGGQEVRTHLIQRAEGRATRLPDTRKLLPQPLTIPPDASHLEMWFERNDTDGYSACDSRFGQNYWFDIKPTMPRQAVSYRAGAGTRLDMVNVFSEKVIKVNAFPRPGSSHVGVDYETRLFVQAWVHNSAFAKYVWVDLHVFDADDQLMDSQTLPLEWSEPAGGDGDFFVINGTVYQGTTATPGSVSPRPSARKVQYRLYYEVEGNVYSDGVLHQHELEDDAMVR